MVVRGAFWRLTLTVVILLGAVFAGCSSGGESDDGDETPTPTAQYVTGTVFLDQDGNGARGAGEAGMAGVVVSNGLATTATDASGSFTLAKEGSFIYVTVPGTHAATGPWYRALTGSQFDFGLKSAPEKDADDFTFIHLTDVHLDDATLVSLNQAVEEFKEISPAFVVCTGDLVNTGDGRTISEEQAARWFAAYRTAMSGLTMPVYNAPGNHDQANLACEWAVDAREGCSKNAFRTSFGPTYYSFDWGRFHCVVLDPNEVSAGSEVFEISPPQLTWLQSDLGRRQKNSPLLVFFHGPTANWQSQDTVLSLLAQYRTWLFSGHSHANLLMDSQGIPEQVTAAFSGEWGHGDNPDGSQPGYRIVSIEDDSLDSFYKHTGSAGQVEISPVGAAWPIVSGQVELTARVYSDNGTVSGVTYSVDNGTAAAMAVTNGQKWATARVAWDTSALSDYHSITVTAADGAGSFQAQATVKVSTETTLTIKDLQDHFRVYQGHYVTIQGVTDQAMFYPNIGVPAGSGGARFNDGTGTALIYAGECHSPALPSVNLGNTIRVKVIPMRFTWAFIDSPLDREGTFGMMKMQDNMLPQAQKEDADGTRMARWYLRVVTAGGIEVL
jgi:hypothetical protein